jgi:hypothetical protein
MSVQFNEEDNGSLLYARLERSSRTPGVVAWLQKIGLAKSDRQATYVLLVCIVILIGVMVYSLSTLQPPEVIEAPDPYLSV